MVRVKRHNKKRSYHSLAGYFQSLKESGIKQVYRLSYNYNFNNDHSAFYSHKKKDINSRIKEEKLKKYTIEIIDLV